MEKSAPSFVPPIKRPYFIIALDLIVDDTSFLKTLSFKSVYRM